MGILMQADPDLKGKALEGEVTTDILAFDAWFKARGNESLVRSEVAILKTYCFYKLLVEPAFAAEGAEGTALPPSGHKDETTPVL